MQCAKGQIAGKIKPFPTSTHKNPNKTAFLASGILEAKQEIINY